MGGLLNNQPTCLPSNEDQRKQGIRSRNWGEEGFGIVGEDWSFADSEENGRERYGELMEKNGNKGREIVRKEFENIFRGELNSFL